MMQSTMFDRSPWIFQTVLTRSRAFRNWCALGRQNVEAQIREFTGHLQQGLVLLATDEHGPRW